VAVLLAVVVVGCGPSPENNIAQPKPGGKPPPPTALKKVGAQGSGEGSAAQ
jgi:hypothetical protein